MGAFFVTTVEGQVELYVSPLIESSYEIQHSPITLAAVEVQFRRSIAILSGFTTQNLYITEQDSLGVLYQAQEGGCCL